MTQYIEFEWDGHNENKIQQRHNVLPEEAEECFFNRHKIRRYGSRYWLYGQTDAGRYLFPNFSLRKKSLIKRNNWKKIRKGVHKIRIISARDMTDREKQYFRRR